MTITLIAASWLMFFYEPKCLHDWLIHEEAGRFALLVIHPIVHGTFGHLAGNTLLILPIVGVLVELWMTRFTRKERYFIYVFCYLVSLAGSFVGWMAYASTIPVIGASGIVSAATAFTIWYYLKFHYQGLKSLAPIGIGIAFFPLVSAPITAIVTGELPDSAMLHYFAFFLAFVLALATGRILLYRKGQ